MPSSRREFLVRTGAAAAALSSWPAELLARTTRPASDERVRLAVVGGGFGASHHWHEHPGCVVTAVTDLEENRRQRLRRQYGCDDVYPSLEVMLEKASDRFDAVAVFTDAPSHVRHAVMCFDAGKHVVSACPAATTLEDAKTLVAAQQRTGLRYMMHESSWYRQECIAARELYRSGGLGRLIYSEFEYYHDGIGTRSDNRQRWGGEKSWRMGFPPMLYPTHSLGFLVGTTGERIVKVSCLGQRIGDDFPFDGENAYDNPFSNEMALGITDQGNICRFGVFWAMAAEGERGQWFGEKQACYMGSSSGQSQMTKPRHGRAAPWEVPRYWEGDRLPEAMRHPSGHGGSSVFLCHDFIEALLNDREPVIDLAESLAMTVPGIVAHQSALQGGKQLEVPRLGEKHG